MHLKAVKVIVTNYNHMTMCSLNVYDENYLSS